MSYILDAIKKSEAERNKGVSPGALAGPLTVTGRRIPVRAITAVVLLNAAALGTWWWVSADQSQNTTLDRVEPRGLVATAPATAAPGHIDSDDTTPALTGTSPGSSRTAKAVPPSRTATTGRSVPENQTLAVQHPAMQSPPALRPTNPAPARAQRERPAMPEFSTHVYADDPELRAVTLDGRRLTEGDDIVSGMRILQITENGVVVDYYGERIEFDVLQGWRS